MNRCPITYQLCGSQKYSREGLRLLSPKLKELQDFPFSAEQQRALAARQAMKMSIQGIQPKLSVVLSVSHEAFEIVERGGMYILKPPHHIFTELPQNEDLTMRLAAMVELEVPLHGMIYNNDGSFTYFIKRFDRLARGHKVALEDFSQLMGASRDAKYDSSMEKLIMVIEKHCTFPLLEKMKFFRLSIFNFLVGNEDAHLKNFSLIRREGKVELSPMYDLLNSTIVIKSGEELALSLRGKKSRLNRIDWLEYFGRERLGLASHVIEEEMDRFKHIAPLWKIRIQESFMSKKMQGAYLEIFQERLGRLAN